MSADVFNRILNVFFFQPVELVIPSGEVGAYASQTESAPVVNLSGNVSAHFMSVVLLADSFAHAQQIGFRMGGVVMSAVTSHQEGCGLKSPGTSLCGVHQVFPCLLMVGCLFIIDLHRAGYQSVPCICL